MSQISLLSAETWKFPRHYSGLEGRHCTHAPMGCSITVFSLPVNGCEKEHLKGLIGQRCAANDQVLICFCQKAGKLPSRGLLQQDGSLLIVSISFCKWPQFFFYFPHQQRLNLETPSAYTNIPCIICWSLIAEKERGSTRSLSRYFQVCIFSVHYRLCRRLENTRPWLLSTPRSLCLQLMTA